jgi:hypothetical protein
MVESAASFECFTKLQAAERQLRVAIRLFFERRDLVAIHTLAAAAQEVLRDLGCPRGIKSIFKGSDLIRPEYKDELAHRFNEAQNFFKHADRDPDKELKFYYKTTKFYLLDAALLYNELTGRTLPEIAVLSAWFVTKFPDIVAKGPLEEQIKGLDLGGTTLDDFRHLLDTVAPFTPEPPQEV